MSAVDAQTSRHILKHCFQSTLMSSRTIIIASHAVEALAPMADHAVFLEDGRAKWRDNGPDLLNTEFMAHLQTKDTDSNGQGSSSKPQGTASGFGEDLDVRQGLDDYVVQRAPLKTPRQVLLDEDKIKGAIDRQHWINLVRQNGGPVFFAAYLVTTGCSLAMPVVENSVLKWVNDPFTRHGGRAHSSLPLTGHGQAKHGALAPSSGSRCIQRYEPKSSASHLQLTVSGGGPCYRLKCLCVPHVLARWFHSSEEGMSTIPSRLRLVRGSLLRYTLQCKTASFEQRCRSSRRPESVPLHNALGVIWQVTIVTSSTCRELTRR